MNKVHDTFQEVTPIQTLKSLFSKAQMNLRQFGDAKWELVAADLERDRPSMTGHGIPMRGFLSDWAGGGKGQFLDELLEHSCSLKFRRFVGGFTWKLLANVKFYSGPACVLAMAKAALTAPESFLQRGGSRLFNSADIDAISASKKHQCIEAVAMFTTAKEFLQQVGSLTKVQKTMLIGDLEVRAVMAIHGKKSRSRKTYESLHAVGQAFLHDLYALVPSTRTLEPPWKLEEKKDCSPKVSQLREFTEKGLGLVEVKKLGFTEGATVELKDGPAMMIKGK
eukprot:6394704-Pyramimonas_sp.AAC.1